MLFYYRLINNLVENLLFSQERIKENNSGSIYSGNVTSGAVDPRRVHQKAKQLWNLA
jgi:hypothetical protein